MDLIKQIQKLKKDRNAMILAHNYQNPEVQDIADYVGDSLELAQIAARLDADVIVFCGVHFMAESASILSPSKKVLLPDLTSGCPMAEMVTADDVIKLKQQYKDAIVVTYINSTADVKAVTDVCVTSSNAVKIVKKLSNDKVLFFPDKNLANYVQRFTDKQIIAWKGFCPTHESFTKDDLIKIKEKHPDAIVMVHPECRPEVIDMADEVLSTGQMVKFVKNKTNEKIIVGTEVGMVHRLKKESPTNEYIIASEYFVCPDMKKNSIEKIYEVMLNLSCEVRVSDEIRVKALKPLQKMLELS